MKIVLLRVTETFERQFRKLPLRIQVLAAEKEEVFKNDPFDSTLATHKLHGKEATMWALSVNRAYRIKFAFLENGVVVLSEIGTHGIYR
jgi:plasmid maintenance system killer protein